MSTIMEKIKAFFADWGTGGSEKKPAPSAVGEEAKPQEAEVVPKPEQPAQAEEKKAEQQQSL